MQPCPNRQACTGNTQDGSVGGGVNRSLELIRWQLNIPLDDLLGWCYGAPPSGVGGAALAGKRFLGQVEAEDEYQGLLCEEGAHALLLTLRNKSLAAARPPRPRAEHSIRV